MKKFTWAIAIMILAVILSGCGNDSDGAGGDDSKTVGLSMPTKSSETLPLVLVDMVDLRKATHPATRV